MIIGLMGQKGSGKDTVGAYLIKEHQFERRAFADPGKRYLASVLGIQFADIERYKNDPNAVIELYSADTADGPDSNAISLGSQNFREFMQEFIENAKQIFGEDVWVNQTLPVGGFYSGKAIVVTDLRFQVEADRINELGGHIIKIERPGLEQNPHRSEVEQHSITQDFTVVNDGSIERLYDRVNNILDNILVGNSS